MLTKKRINLLDSIINELRGTCNESIKEVAERLGVYDLIEEDIYYIYDNVFLCQGCGWCSRNEEVYNDICEDCSTMIIASAIKFFLIEDKKHKFPQIWTAKRHPDVFELMFKMNVKYDKENYTQGFLTDTNEFLDRYDAYEYAVNADQVDVNDIKGPQLYSEDIWPE